MTYDCTSKSVCTTVTNCNNRANNCQFKMTNDYCMRGYPPWGQSNCTVLSSHPYYMKIMYDLWFFKLLTFGMRVALECNQQFKN